MKTARQINAQNAGHAEFVPNPKPDKKPITMPTEDQKLRELDAEIAVLVFGWEWLERPNEECGKMVTRKAIFAPDNENWIRWNFNANDWSPARPETLLFADWFWACSERDDDGRLGNKRIFGLPHYTTDPTAAMMVLKECAKKRVKLFISLWNEVWFIGDGEGMMVQAKTLEQAACLFARQLFTQTKKEL